MEGPLSRGMGFCNFFFWGGGGGGGVVSEIPTAFLPLAANCGPSLFLEWMASRGQLHIRSKPGRAPDLQRKTARASSNRKDDTIA